MKTVGEHPGPEVHISRVIGEIRQPDSTSETQETGLAIQQCSPQNEAWQSSIVLHVVRADMKSLGEREDSGPLANHTSRVFGRIEIVGCHFFTNRSNVCGTDRVTNVPRER